LVTSRPQKPNPNWHQQFNLSSLLKINLRHTAIIVICMLAGINNMQAQEKIHSARELPRNYLINVKQLSEFIDRFNFRKDFLNQDIGPEFESIITRDDYLRLLFNEEDERLDPGNENKSYQDLMDSFVHKVCTDSIYINPFSELIYAELTCQVNIKGNKEELDLLLKREIDNGLKWAIISVNRNFRSEAGYQPDKDQDTGRTDRPKIYIPPLSNEINFIDLKTLLNDQKNLSDLSANDCVKENVFGFYDMIRKGAVKYQYVKSLHYHILDIPGWVIIVNNFRRNTDNSGWLISNLEMRDDRSNYFKAKYAYSLPGTFIKF
jgi:hypothetical protein